jgi:hypothetical protein
MRPRRTGLSRTSTTRGDGRNSSGRCGLRIFTGEADNPGAAIQIAYKVYAAAVAAQQSGLRVRRRDGWGERGMRSGWELDWSAATASLWNDPYSCRHVITCSRRSAPEP